MIDEHSTYLSNLLGHPVDWRDAPKLTSGQKARYFAWCQANDLEYRLGADASESVDGSSAFRGGATTVTTYAGSAAAPLSVSGVGVDIQQISELFPETLISPKTDDSLASLFSKRELSYAEGADDVRQTLSGLFAAKEAIFKAGGPQLVYANVSEIEILPQGNGAPGHDGYLLSISHSGDFAVAVAARLNDPAETLDNDTVNPVSEEKALTSSKASATKKADRKYGLRHRAMWLMVSLGTIGGIWFLAERLVAQL